MNASDSGLRGVGMGWSSGPACESVGTVWFAVPVAYEPIASVRGSGVPGGR